MAERKDWRRFHSELDEVEKRIGEPAASAAPEQRNCKDDAWVKQKAIEEDGALILAGGLEAACKHCGRQRAEHHSDMGCIGTYFEPIGRPAPPAPAAPGEWEDEVMRIVKATESFDPENREIYKAAATFAAEFAKYKLASAEQELATERQQVEQLAGDVKAIQHDYTNAARRNRELEQEVKTLLEALKTWRTHHPADCVCRLCERTEAALAKGSE